MAISRRSLLKFGAVALGAGLAARSGWLPSAMAMEPAPRPLNLLILGGTGFTGPHQVRYALARGHRVTLLNRGRRPQEWPSEVEELVGDRNLGELQSLAERRWDACIDNPTSLPFWVRDVGKVLAGNVDQYVFISTLSVYADNSRPGEDEQAALAAYTGADPMAETMETLRANVGGLYGPLKATCEAAAQEWFGERATILRPGLIVGPGDDTDRFTYWPVRLDRGGRVLAPGSGEDPVQIIDARDLAEWTIRMVEARAYGVFNAMGPAETLTMAGMLEGIAAAIGSDAELVFADTAFLREQGVRPWADMPVWLPGEGDTLGFSTRSNARALAAGLTFRPLAETATATLAWFRSLPEERQAQLRAGIAAEREQEVLAAWAAREQAA